MTTTALSSMSGILASILERIGIHIVDYSIRRLSEARTAPNEQRSRSPVVRDWHERLNQTFGAEFQVLRTSSKEPRLVYEEDGENFHPPSDMTAEIERQKARLSEADKPNERHLIVSPYQEPFWNADPPTLYVRRTDYATICAYRDRGTPLKTISGCAVLICSEDQELILHRRSPKSDTGGGLCHIVGGAYYPDDAKKHDVNNGTLRNTILRELVEEAKLFPNPKTEPSRFLASQVDREGWIQFTYLGLDITSHTKNLISTNWEGHEVFVPFTEIDAWLTSDELVANGRALLLAWLAYGAPNANAPKVLGKRRCRDLFENALAWVNDASGDPRAR